MNLKLLTIIAFFIGSLGPIPEAQADPAFSGAGGMPLPRAVLAAYVPMAIVKGLTIHPQNPLQVDFIVEPTGAQVNRAQLKDESLKMIKYFLASLTMPQEDMWVNLSPYEKDRIIPKNFGQTIMGRDLLGQDYLLKQMTASLIYPDTSLGREFWSRVYKQAHAEYGTTNIPINTFNKVWIVPDKATVWEHGQSVFVVERHLKVMLEQDYLALNKNTPTRGTNQPTNTLTSQVVRAIIIPELEKEVNQGSTFAQLRQIYNAMILATWYKKRLKESLLGKVYVDCQKISGVDHQTNGINEIYQRYLRAFRKGTFNFIKEEPDPATGEMVPRKYFSGGIEAMHARILKIETGPVVSIDPLNYPNPRDFIVETDFAMSSYNTEIATRKAMKIVHELALKYDLREGKPRKLLFEMARIMIDQNNRSDIVLAILIERMHRNPSFFEPDWMENPIHAVHRVMDELKEESDFSPEAAEITEDYISGRKTLSTFLQETQHIEEQDNVEIFVAAKVAAKYGLTALGRAYVFYYLNHTWKTPDVAIEHFMQYGQAANVPMARNILNDALNEMGSLGKRKQIINEISKEFQNEYMDDPNPGRPIMWLYLTGHTSFNRVLDVAIKWQKPHKNITKRLMATFILAAEYAVKYELPKPQRFVIEALMNSNVKDENQAKRDVRETLSKLINDPKVVSDLVNEIINSRVFLDSLANDEVADSAMQAQNLGGIDMNMKNLDLSVQGQEGKFEVTADPNIINPDNISGITPIIISITPVGNTLSNSNLQ